MHIYDISDKLVALQVALEKRFCSNRCVKLAASQCTKLGDTNFHACNHGTYRSSNCTRVKAEAGDAINDKHESIDDMIKTALSTQNTNEQRLSVLIDRMEVPTSLTTKTADDLAGLLTFLDTLFTALGRKHTILDGRADSSNVAFQQFEKRLDTRLDALSTVAIPIPSSSGIHIGSCSKRESHAKNDPDSESSGDETEEELSNSESEGSSENIAITDLDQCFPEVIERQSIAPIHISSLSSSSSSSSSFSLLSSTEDDLFFLSSIDTFALQSSDNEPEQPPIEVHTRRSRKPKTFTGIFGGFLIVFGIFVLFNWNFFGFETENANNFFLGLVAFWFLFIVLGRALLSFLGRVIWSRFGGL